MPRELVEAERAVKPVNGGRNRFPLPSLVNPRLLSSFPQAFPSFTRRSFHSSLAKFCIKSRLLASHFPAAPSSAGILHFVYHHFVFLPGIDPTPQQSCL